MIKGHLIQQGLTGKEADIYLKLVRYGASRAAEVCKRSKQINRSLVYMLLDNLVRKGIAEKITRNGKQFYVPNDPEVFVHLADRRHQQAKFLSDELQSIQMIKSFPVVRTFRGFQSLVEMRDMLLEEAQQTGETMLQIGQEIYLEKNHPEVLSTFIQSRVDKKIPLKLISNEACYTNEFLSPERDKKELREVRVVNNKDFNADGTSYMYGDSMAVISFSDEMVGYILKSQNATGLHRQMFHLLWNSLPEIFISANN